MTGSARRRRPRRPPLGQNFLIDRGAVRRIVEALAPSAADPVLEIGPGRGALTGALLERARRVLAIELDRGLADALRRRFPEERLLLVHEDFLNVDLARAASWLGRPAGTPLLVAGNLPYGISKPVARKLVTERGCVSRAVLMFQREVADRLTAEPGERAYAPLTVLVSLCFVVERLFDLPPAAFRPRPAIRSTVTRWTLRDPSLLDAALESRLSRCLAASFRRRRQTLHNNRVGRGERARPRRGRSRRLAPRRVRVPRRIPRAGQRLAALALI